jgi:cytochrome c peroxidase
VGSLLPEEKREPLSPSSLSLSLFVAPYARQRTKSLSLSLSLSLSVVADARRQRTKTKQTKQQFGLAAFALGASAATYYAHVNNLLPPGLLPAGLLPQGSALSSAVDYDKVRKSIADAMESNADYDGLGSYGPVLVRLAWHCAGTYDKKTNTGGSDGATMRFAPESNHGANAGLAVARDLLEPIKKKFPCISYADLYTLAGVVAIEEMGGPEIKWKPGRRDAVSGAACPPDGRLPDASQGAKHVREVFSRMGFETDREMVALCGAHALGKCHTDRSGYDGPWTRSPTTMSNEYYVQLTNPAGWRKKVWKGPLQYENADGADLMMLPADMALLWDKGFKKHVDEFAKDGDAFAAAFADAFSKLLELGVKRDAA